MRRWVFGIAFVCVALAAAGLLVGVGRDLPGPLAALAGKVEGYLPDSFHSSMKGDPGVKPAVEELVARGSGLKVTYRDLWQQETFPAGRYEGVDIPRRVCAKEDARTDCDFRSLNDALAAAGEEEALIVSPGIYEEAAVINKRGLHLIAEPGAHMRGKAMGGKGALLVQADDVTIEGLECSDIQVSDRNGACVRLEAHNLTLRGVNFHDSQQGLLAGSNYGLIVIEDSVFNRLGQGGRAHGIYLGGGRDSTLIVRRSHFLNTRNEGHGIKSRASENIIESNVIASLNETDSRAIDLPNGGTNFISGNIIQNGANSSNLDVIGIGLELKGPAELPAAHASRVVGNLFILDRNANNLVHARNVPEPEMISNMVVGGADPSLPEGNFYIRSRDLAGLPPAPDLLEQSSGTY